MLDKLKQYLNDNQLLLPVKKINYPNSHIFLTNPSLGTVWDNIGIIEKGSALFSIVRATRNLSLKNSALALYAINGSLKIFASMCFFGLQEMRYSGFTAYKDNRLSSFSSVLKQVLRPEEYVFYKTPVYSIAEGEVLSINNRCPDKVHQLINYSNSFLSPNNSELYGNYIIIRNSCFNILYGGLNQSSLRNISIGDKIRAGEQIAEVGCSGNLSELPCLSLSLSFSLDFLRSIGLEKFSFLEEITLPLLNFKPFYSFPIMDYIDKNIDDIDRFYVKNVKYVYNSGRIIKPGMFIKQ